MVKKLIFIGIFFVLISANANATYYSLVSCNFKYIPEMSASKYVGVYKSQFGNLFTSYFDSYCPASLNQ
jgi:hypothetical protein